MKPNGIFYIAAGKVVVAETQAFLKQRPQADLATQSGPMLVINGRLHPRFDRGSTSLKARNGVEYARMAKSYSPSLKERRRLTPLLAYSVTG